MRSKMRRCLLVLIGNVVLLAQANIPTGQHSGNKSNTYSKTNNDEGDIPIISDQFQRRRSNDTKRRRSGSRRSRTRRRHQQEDDHKESNVDDNIPAFSLFGDDDEYDDMGYEREQIRKRRRRRNQHAQADDQSKVMFGLGAHIDSLRSWTEAKTGIRIPRINIYCDPVTILKLRKAWSVPGMPMIFKIGADFETHRLRGGYWRLRACCEDKLIHGRITLKEVQSSDDDDENDVLVEYSKSWTCANTAGAATRFNLCAAYSTLRKSGGVRFGIRTENNVGAIGRVTSSPFNGNQRFSVIPVLKLDEDERFKVEVKTNIDVPNPELVLGMDLEGRNGSVGIAGSIDIEVEELNLIASF